MSRNRFPGEGNYDICTLSKIWIFSMCLKSKGFLDYGKIYQLKNVQFFLDP